ncbi:MAG: type II and III secretion system protein family protein [Phycisphaerae bacterium]
MTRCARFRAVAALAPCLALAATARGGEFAPGAWPDADVLICLAEEAGVLPNLPVDRPAPGSAAAPRPAALTDEEMRLAYAPADEPPAASPTPAAASLPGIMSQVRAATAAADKLRVVKDKAVFVQLKRPVTKVQIAAPEVADVAVTSPTEIAVIGKKFGVTQLKLTTADGQEAVIDLLVEVDVAVLEELVRTVAPTAAVRVRSLFDNLILTGSVPDATTAQRIVEMAEMVSPGRVRNQMSVAGSQQVLIRCTVAEVNRSAMRELNMNWFFGGSPVSRDFFFANNLNGLNPTTVNNPGLANLLVGQQTYSMLPVQNGGATNLTLGFPRAELQFFVRALRTNGLIRVLAEPNVIALSGQPASILVGGEVPIPLVLQNTFQVDYHRFGVLLEFTPTVLAGQQIRMTLRPEVSDLDPTRQVVVAGFVIPAFTTRRAESTLEVGNGQTFAMAGLLNETVRANARKIPGIGDLPVLGTLFSSVEYTRDETELVVLVTPELVAPLDPQQVRPVPGQKIREPNDFELFFTQQLEAGPRATREMDEVPRHHMPVNAYPPATSWSDATVNTALRGPCGISVNEEEGTP